jgi:hypothetical protein
MATKKKAAKKPSEYVNLKLTRDEARRLRDVLEVTHVSLNGVNARPDEQPVMFEAALPYPTSIDWVVWDRLDAMAL